MRVGDLFEIAKFLSIPARAFDRALKSGKPYQNRYEILYLFEEVEIENV